MLYKAVCTLCNWLALWRVRYPARHTVPLEPKRLHPSLLLLSPPHPHSHPHPHPPPPYLTSEKREKGRVGEIRWSCVLQFVWICLQHLLHSRSFSLLPAHGFSMSCHAHLIHYVNVLSWILRPSPSFLHIVYSGMIQCVLKWEEKDFVMIIEVID